jgi:hypothetical protein
MKRFASILATFALIFTIFATPAHAISTRFKNCPTTKQNGITYILYKKYAIVKRTPNRKTVVIPNTIKVKGKKYCVSSVWEGTFEKTPKLRVVDLKATNLECIEDPAIFDNHNIKVIAHDALTYKWLKRNHVNVTFKH